MPPSRALRLPRPLLATTAALAALVAGSGCERPSPSISVYSGPTYLNARALCWSQEGEVRREQCVGGVGRETLRVRAGDLIMINVDKPLEETGWIPTINGIPLVREPLHDSAYNFALSAEDLRQSPEVQVLASDRIDGPLHGIWAIPLEYRN